MKNELEPTAAEEVAAHPFVVAGLGLLAGAGAATGVLAAPLAGLVPALIGSLAAARATARFEAFARNVNSDLEMLEIKVQGLSDFQYKLIGECLSIAMRGETAERLELLRRSILGALTLEELREQEVAGLTRILRDITTDEAAFVGKYFGFEQIYVVRAESVEEHMAKGGERIAFADNSLDSIAAHGLASVGVLSPGMATYGSLAAYQFAPIAAKLLVLLNAPLPK